MPCVISYATAVSLTGRLNLTFDLRFDLDLILTPDIDSQLCLVVELVLSRHVASDQGRLQGGGVDGSCVKLGSGGR